MKIITALLLIIFTFSFSSQKINSAAVGWAYGGYVTFIFTCTNGLLAFVAPSRPMLIMQDYVAMSLYKGWGPARTPKQATKGKGFNYSPCMVPCPAGTCPYTFALAPFPAMSGSSLL